LAAANPDDVFVLLEMGDIYQEAGNPSAAEQSYKDARSINPKDPRAGLALARLFNESDPARALNEIDDVLVRNPENLQALALRAQLLIGLKRRPDALATFEEALAIAPDNVTINNNFAWALVYDLDPKDRNCERGLSLAQRAVEGSQRREASHLDTLAEAYRCGGNYDQALSTLDEALALSPENDFYKTHRAEIAAEKAKPIKGKPKKAKK
jgi:Tfp pilus assembly protein PilF